MHDGEPRLERESIDCRRHDDVMKVKLLWEPLGSEYRISFRSGSTRD